jgi:hypothetical protein
VTNLNSTLYAAMEKHYAGEYAKHAANLSVYFINPAGIGEHPGIIEAMDCEIQKMAEAQEKLQVLMEFWDDFLNYDA